MARIVVALMLREISTTYGRSAGGYLWAVLDPVLGIGLLTFVFSMMTRAPAIGTNFALFYASGFLPFAMFNDLSGKIARSIQFSRPLLAYPSVTFVDTLLARTILNTLTHCCVFMVIMAGIVFIYQLPVNFHAGYILESLAVTAAFALGVGTVNCYLMITFPIYERVWSILTRPLFLISAVFFLIDMLPSKVAAILWWNPLVHCVGLMRRGIYPTYEAAYVSVSYVMTVSVILLFFGMLLLLRNFRDLAER